MFSLLLNSLCFSEITQTNLAQQPHQMPYVCKQSISVDTSLNQAIVLPRTTDTKMLEFSKVIYSMPSLSTAPRIGNVVVDTIHFFPVKCNVEDLEARYSDKVLQESSHFSIDASGRIYQHVSVDQQGYHARMIYDRFFEGKERRQPDKFSVGIGLLVGEKRKTTYTSEQVSQLNSLINYLCKAFSIKQVTCSMDVTKSLFNSYKDFPWDRLTVSKNGLLVKPDLKMQLARLTKDPDMKDFDGTVYRINAAGPGTATTLSYTERFDNPKIDTIVLHHTECSFISCIKLFTRPSYKITSHFTIDKDGLMMQHVDLKDRAKHAGSFNASKDRFGRTDVNNFSIGIELVNRATGTDPYPPAQMHVLKKLLAYLIKKFSISTITSHEKVAWPRGRKDDPKGFSWNELAIYKDKLDY